MTRPRAFCSIFSLAAALACGPPSLDRNCDAEPADPGCDPAPLIEGHFDLTLVGEAPPPNVALEGGTTTITITSGSMDLTAEGEVTGAFVLERTTGAATTTETDWFAGTYQADGTSIEFEFSDLLLGDDRSDQGSFAESTLSFVLSATDGELSDNVFVFFTIDASG